MTNFPRRCPAMCARTSHPMSQVTRPEPSGCEVVDIVATCPTDRRPIETCFTISVTFKVYKTESHDPSALSKSFSTTYSLSSFLHFCALGSEFTNHSI